MERVFLEILYRKGRKEDALFMAGLVRAAAGGVVEYLFHELVPGVTPVQAVASGLEREDGFHSYRNALVAVHQEAVVGVALAYPSRHHRVTPEMEKFFPKERLEHLRCFYEARVEESLYLDSLAVEPGFQRRGIGAGLIHGIQQKAKQMGIHAVSLMVFADNDAALQLYEKMGFELVQRVDLAPHALIPHEGGCLLLRCDVSSGSGEQE
jgi:ribosomal protein S18 acetylase RimI-like enzyme